MSCQQGNQKAMGTGQKFSQKLVNREPVYDKRLKIKRPRKTGTGPKWV